MDNTRFTGWKLEGLAMKQPTSYQGLGVYGADPAHTEPLTAPPLVIGMQDASDSAEGLHKAIAHLEQRLSFVLKPAPGNAVSAGDNVPRVAVAPAIERLRDVVGRITYAQVRINELIDRLEC